MLGWAATELFLERVRRFPFGGDDSRFLEWLVGSMGLGHAIAVLGLWPNVYYGTVSRRASEWLLRGLKEQERDRILHSLSVSLRGSSRFCTDALWAGPMVASPPSRI